MSEFMCFIYNLVIDLFCHLDRGNFKRLGQSVTRYNQ